MRGGASLAYASEAGMPAIADPGFELARAMHDANLPVTCAPGPSAAATALAVAGLPTDAFMFLGFLPNAQSARRQAIEAVADVAATLVLYESPKRLAKCLADLATVLGDDRNAAVCRELTKKFEEVRRGSLSVLTAAYQGANVKGELVVLVERGHSPIVREIDLENEIKAALSSMSVRDAADAIAQAHGVKRRTVYNLALKLSAEEQDDTDR